MVVNHARWRELEPLLDEALELAPEARADWLADLRLRAPDVADDVGRLLARDGAAEREGFLKRPAQLSLAGLELDGWRLERPIGDGGMGSVWLAQRSDGRFEGRAAVKLLSLALVGAAGEARFRREGSALARLTHPAIARLFDAGVTPGGQPYFVLEYVEGTRIDRWVRERNLSIEGRIRLFLKVLDAVSHAHANLVVHRDLKPSNILVTAEGSVKLLDFGIAKLLDDGGPAMDGAASQRISIEGWRAMTPEYAAPEQVRMGPITTATDIYAAGVLLYVLLTGRHPTAEGCASTVEVLRALVNRDPEPAGLGDLDAVLSRALNKDPANRYPGMSAYAEDLNRWLQGRPVSAHEPSVRYTVAKYLRRHALGASIAAAATLLTGLYLGSLVWGRARVDLGAVSVAIDLSELGGALNEQGRSAESEVLRRAAGDLLRAAYPGGIDGDSSFAEALSEAGKTLVERGRYEDAEAVLRRALGLGFMARPGADSIRARTRAYLGLALAGQGKHVEAAQPRR